MNMTEIIQNRIALLIGAFLLDLLLGDPHWLWHPVQGIGWVISAAEGFLQKLLGFTLPPARPDPADIEKKPAEAGGKGRNRVLEHTAGILEVLIVLTASLGVFFILRALLAKLHPAAGTLFELILCWQLIACRSLWKAAMDVYRPLMTRDNNAARTAVSMIVGRDTDRLDRTGITKAAVETVAESTSDGVAAPVFYLALFGPVGMLFYKAVNTMDSMIAYRNVRYQDFGTAAARLDDVLNYIPSRLAALLMIAASWLLHPAEKDKYDAANAVRIWCRDRRKHPSPNSAQTESVCAGALRIQLAGDAWYFGELHHKPTLGDPLREIEPDDIRRACLLMFVTALLTVLFLILVLCAAGAIVPPAFL